MGQHGIMWGMLDPKATVVLALGQTLIAAAFAIGGVLLGQKLQRDNTLAAEKRRASGRLTSVLAELHRNTARLEVISEAPRGSLPIEDAVYNTHREVLAELLNETQQDALQAAYAEVARARALLAAKRTLSAAQADVIRERINEAIAPLVPKDPPRRRRRPR